MDIIIHYIINFILLVAASFLVWYFAFVKYFGIRFAKLITEEDITRIKETVKKEFQEELENLKAELQKQNVSYQILFGELTKRRLDKLEELYYNFVVLQKYIKLNLFSYKDDSDFQRKKVEFEKLYSIADDSRLKCIFYIDDELMTNMINVLNNSFEAYHGFIGLYNSDPKKYGDILFQAKQEIIKHNIDFLNKLLAETEKFPKLLDELVKAIKKRITL